MLTERNTRKNLIHKKLTTNKKIWPNYLQEAHERAQEFKAWLAIIWSSMNHFPLNRSHTHTQQKKNLLKSIEWEHKSRVTLMSTVEIARTSHGAAHYLNIYKIQLGCFSNIFYLLLFTINSYNSLLKPFLAFTIVLNNYA